MPSQAPVSAHKRNSYTDEQRTQALADAATLGTCAAARKHGLPASTLSRWRTEQRAAIPVAQPTATQSAKPTATRTRGEPAKRKVAKHYTPSQKAEVVEYARKHGATKASKEFGPSRYSIYAWIRKAEAAAKGQLVADPASENPSIEELRDAEILEEYKRHPGLGPSQIKNQLRRKSIKVSVHTVRRVMESAGYRPPKVDPPPRQRGAGDQGDHGRAAQRHHRLRGQAARQRPAHRRQPKAVQPPAGLDDRPTPSGTWSWTPTRSRGRSRASRRSSSLARSCNNE